MFNFLKYFDGAQPGKKRKQTIEDEEKSNKKADYEKHRKERSFNEGWCVGRPWLSFEQANKSMHCKLCRSHYQNSNGEKSTFITGCTNFKTSAVVDHEKSRPHIKAQQVEESRQKSSTDKLGTKAGAALLSLKAADRSRLTILFRNAHAVAKYNRPLSDYHWLCKLDIAKGVQQLQIDSTTYLNDKAAVNFIHSIAKTELQVTKQIFDETHFLAFLMDGTTDISGSEQESIYLRGCLRGKVTERFLNISSPESTTAEDLYKHVITVFEKNEISTDKLVALGSDGASNMTGVRSGLATLLRDRINPELFNVHCLCHRLELAFRDVVKKTKTE